MIAASLGFTVNSAMVKSLTAGGLDVFQIAFARALFSFALVAPFLLRARPRSLHTRHPVLHGIRAFPGAAAMLSGFYAVGRLHLADSPAPSSTQPLFVPVLAVILPGEVVSWRCGLGWEVGSLGVHGMKIGRASRRG